MKSMAGIKPVLMILVVLLIAGMAWGLRWQALDTLNVDYDEDDYLRAAQQYAAIFRSGNLTGLLETNYRPEHPPLAKMVYGLSILPAPETEILPDLSTTAQPNKYLPVDQKKDARTAGAIFGTLTTVFLALLNPLAGFFLAIHSFTIKYVSEIMLEALPALTSFLSVLFYVKWKQKGQRSFNFWLAGSAVFLGLTAASKYLYCVVGIAMLVDWWLDAKEEDTLQPFLRRAALWGILAVAIFFAADPYLWPDPLGRLKESVFYHAGYASGASEVQDAGFPIWQPLIWLNTTPYSWQPAAFPVAIDPLITLLAAFGVAGVWKKQRVYALWLAVGLAFLFVWPTKWPQYIITLTVPLCLSASHGFSALITQPFLGWVDGLRSRGKTARQTHRSELRQALPWLIPGLVAFTIFTILPLLFQFAVSLTDFNSASIRDGFQGGIWREVSGGLTGQIEPTTPKFPFRTNTVHFTGPSSYQPALDYITGQGILVFNVLWTFLSVGLQTLLGIGAALLLWQRGIRFRRGWEVLFILPWAIPEMLGALMWINVFAPETGWLALAVRDFGPQTPFASLLGWTRDENLTMLVLLISGAWYGFPFMMLAATAGLKMLPTEVYDAAAIDGANGWRTFQYVTWPLMAPLILPAIIIRGIFAFNQFYLFQAFQVGSGTLATLSYNFFNPSGYSINGQFSLSAVLNILTVLILVGFVAWFNRWSKADEGVNYA